MAAGMGLNALVAFNLGLGLGLTYQVDGTGLLGGRAHPHPRSYRLP